MHPPTSAGVRVRHDSSGDSTQRRSHCRSLTQTLTSERTCVFAHARHSHVCIELYSLAAPVLETVNTPWNKELEASQYNGTVLNKLHTFPQQPGVVTLYAFN